MSDTRRPDFVFYIKDLKNNKKQKIEAYDAALWEGSRLSFVAVLGEITNGQSDLSNAGQDLTGGSASKRFRLGEPLDSYQGFFRIRVDGVWWPKGSLAMVSKQDLQEVMFKTIVL